VTHDGVRGDWQIQLAMHEPDQPARVLQPGHIHVEIHPVDSLHLEHHVIVEDISDSARYGHDRLRSGGRPVGQPSASSGFIHRIGPPVTV